MADTEKQIIETVARLKKAHVSQIVNNLPEQKSRQWVSKLLNQLAQEGKLLRSKKGRKVYYVTPENRELIGKEISKKHKNESLNEDFIFEELKKTSPIFDSLEKNVNSILRYAFTEMVNNAIEHSRSEEIITTIKELNDRILCEVRDFGIGVYRNIVEKKGLDSELEAIQELLKGKTTTMPHSHSGEGIFFTSKIVDVFTLDSFEYRLRIDNLIDDVFVDKIDNTPGTQVTFEINRSSDKHLNDIFREYEAKPGSYAFDKTKVHVKLYKAGTIYISRSQARRLLANLEKYRVIILDFTGITTIGQAFADEIFRVFSANHPDVRIEPINITETVKFMIDRVESPPASKVTSPMN